MSEPRITLDRVNLKRLAATLAATPKDWEGLVSPEILPAVRFGWKMAVESIDHLADEMPELYGDHGWPAGMLTGYDESPPHPEG